jgi:Flp pilus assembly protein TadB
MVILDVFSAIDKALKALTVTETVLQMTDSGEEHDSEEAEMSGEDEKRTFSEEIEVQAQQLVDRVKELLHEGNVRKLRIKDGKGKYLLEIPLTVGVVAGGVLVLTAPMMAALSALAGLMTDVKIEVVREAEEEKPEDKDKK